MTDRAMLLQAMRDQNPAKFKRLRETDQLEATIKEIEANHAAELEAAMPADADLNQRRMIEEIARAHAIEAATS